MANKTQRLQQWFEERSRPDAEPYGEFQHVGANQTLVRILLKDVDMAPEMVVLDAACGIGGNARWLASLYGCTVWGYDIDEEALQTAAELAEIEGVSDLCHFVPDRDSALSFDDRKFDVVLSTEGFYHPPEITRVLKPGGLFLLTDYFGASDVTGESISEQYGMDLELSQDVTDLALGFLRAKEIEASLLSEAGLIDARQMVEVMNSGIRRYSASGGRHILARMRKPG
ncbi:MAG: class I SAM-dependent methyltransferase [Chloroflexi bacterium]|jgi:SAM-dependent methyltransferase|nr:class I SAM-dependent methyltransferase [Chloroflexota bacterium]MBT4074503.1 class I SAM-dependent methyltransferase [Chloroflexota bacterium]MBT6682141.1 class I SAM-dependent methyltransferase [Chloroflexota bacterium]